MQSREGSHTAASPTEIISVPCDRRLTSITPLRRQLWAAPPDGWSAPSPDSLWESSPGRWCSLARPPAKVHDPEVEVVVDVPLARFERPILGEG